MPNINDEYLLDINGKQMKEPEPYAIVSTLTKLSSGNLQLSLCINDKTNTLIHILSFHIVFKTIDEINIFRNSSFYKGIIRNFNPYTATELIKFLNI